MYYSADFSLPVRTRPVSRQQRQHHRLSQEETSPVEQPNNDRLVEKRPAGVPLTLGLAVQRHGAANLDEDEDEDDDSRSRHVFSRWSGLLSSYYYIITPIEGNCKPIVVKRLSGRDFAASVGAGGA